MLAEPFYSKAMDRFVEFVMDNIDRLPAQLHVIIYDIMKAGQNQTLTIYTPPPHLQILPKKMKKEKINCPLPSQVCKFCDFQITVLANVIFNQRECMHLYTSHE